MAVYLAFTDPNPSDESIKVYRSLAPMTLGSLPAALVTLSAGTTQYKDDTAEPGTTYYYRVSAMQGSYEAVSEEITLVAPKELTAPVLTLALVKNDAR